jgi:hypothetical protein
MACHALGQSEGLAACERFGNGCACTAAPAVFLRDVMGSALLSEKAGQGEYVHGCSSWLRLKNHALRFYAHRVECGG